MAVDRKLKWCSRAYIDHSESVALIWLDVQHAERTPLSRRTNSILSVDQTVVRHWLGALALGAEVLLDESARLGMIMVGQHNYGGCVVRIIQAEMGIPGVIDDQCTWRKGGIRDDEESDKRC